jgi:uncharacterized protein YhaN
MKGSIDQLKRQFQAAKKDLGFLEQRIITYQRRDRSAESNKPTPDFEVKKEEPPMLKNDERDAFGRGHLLIQVTRLEKEKRDLTDQVAVLLRENKTLSEKVKELQSHAAVHQITRDSRHVKRRLKENSGLSRSSRQELKQSRERLKELPQQANVQSSYGEYMREKSKQFVDRISTSFYR